MTKITIDQARWIKKHIPLNVYSSFTNTEPSELCSEYRVETGYSIKETGLEFIRFVNTRDNDGDDVFSAYLICETEDAE